VIVVASEWANLRVQLITVRSQCGCDLLAEQSILCVDEGVIVHRAS
jgi:hypothetical protein